MGTREKEGRGCDQVCVFVRVRKREKEKEGEKLGGKRTRRKNGDGWTKFSLSGEVLKRQTL